MAAEIRSTSQDGTLVLTIHNPEHRNALAPEIYAAGVEALAVAESNPDIKTVVIVGEGATFSAGGNLTRLKANREQGPEVQAASIEALHTWIESVRTFPKPVIAAVEGAAAGAGFSLVLACDFVVAASNAIFVMAYSNVGLSPDGGGSWSLARMLPHQLVNELLMCGERISAQRLHTLGVVNRLSEPAGALADALALAHGLNQRPGNVLASIKDLVNEATSRPLNAQLAAERDHFVRNLHHANAGIGIDAFLTKQIPRYQ